MNSFKDIAYLILKEAGKPLHSKEITKIALEHGLETVGQTPELTMNALLLRDINNKGELSQFKKIGPSTYTLNDKKVEIEEDAKPASTPFFQSYFLGATMQR